MSQTLEPRTVDPASWKRWVKIGCSLGWRVWISALPLSLIVGLGACWLLETHLAFGLLILPLTGLWQAMLFTLAEQAASGKQVSVLDAWDGVVAYWRLPGKPAQQQLRQRALYALFLTLFVLAMVGFILLLASLSGPGSKPPAVPLPLWKQFADLSSYWAIIFLWSFGLQKGGFMSCMNMLVRKHGMDWGSAEGLWDRAMAKNSSSLSLLAMLGMLGAQAMMFIPVASFFIFPVEVIWACIVTVAARDMFEGKDALEKQEARSSVASHAPTLA